ncbi:unnamed protein product [Ceratitis capitata]|uniref:(Mediterranean fruit fly) hypothetical protein n=2 Tax=Ceratitis capitata TaxID=7213 RepID=A0A811U3C8_CERCA|nr:unnamed protein product [Ceratitis capitata]
MASFEQFVLKVKPTLDMFLRVPHKEHLERLRYELLQFNFREMKIFHVQILAPLVLKLEELNGISSLECLMIIFYVHDEAEFTDVVLRNQVANTVFIYIPKIVTILIKTSLADEKLGETLKSTAIKALGRILCVIFEKSDDVLIEHNYDKKEFKSLINKALQQKSESHKSDFEMASHTKRREGIEQLLEKMRSIGRTKQWFEETSRALRAVYTRASVFRSHDSVRIRTEYARMCCTLMERCAYNLGENYLNLLENVVAMSEDEDKHISKMCTTTLSQLQLLGNANESLFDEYADILFDEHLAKMPRIISRSIDAEQYAELISLKGFLKNLSISRMNCLLLVPKNLEMLCRCLISAVDLKLYRDLLTEAYAIREVVLADYAESAKLGWRQYKHLSSARCVNLVKDICVILGNTKGINRLVYDFLLELLTQNHETMNEIFLIMLWIGTGVERRKHMNYAELVEILLEEILDEKHWHLALRPDASWRLKVDKPTDWFVDKTPGLYESAIEIRTQNVDSDDENDFNEVNKSQRVTILDAEFNVLHTCIALDVLGHCATYYGDRFDRYIFRCLHKVLLKVSCSNTMVYQAANFCLVSIQKALKFAEVTHLIETHTDYLNYHLNTILKRSPESHAAVDILTVVLQLSTRRALPHLENIFQTIYNECSKSQQSENINAYLRVFSAFLKHVARWQATSNAEVAAIPMQIEQAQEEDLLQNWLDLLEKPSTFIENEEANVEGETNSKTPTDSTEDVEMKTEEFEAAQEGEDVKPPLPRYIQMVKDIITQVLKFVSFADKTHQILALECLISCVPLLHDYEDELLPLVHLMWSPLVEKFRNNDAVVLNRCFTLLNVLATHAKEFILKRSLDDVIPSLKEFLRKASKTSMTETIAAHTQEYKLQLILLENFANLITCLQIDGKHLYEIAETVSVYLAKEQPCELQELAVQFYLKLHQYNGPFSYITVLKKAHICSYKDNAEKVLTNIFKSCI